MAKQAAGSSLYADFLRCDTHQGARRGNSSQQGGLCSSWRTLGRNEGNLGLMDRTERGRQVLAKGDARAEEQRRRGRADCYSRRSQGLFGGDHGGLSAGTGADLRRSSHTPLAGVRIVQGSQGVCIFVEANLQGQGRECRLVCTRRLADGQWGKKYTAIALYWRRNWAEYIFFFAFLDEVRRIIYTTNSIESLNAKLRRAVGARVRFHTDESALNLLFLVLNLAAKEWKILPQSGSWPRPNSLSYWKTTFSRRDGKTAFTRKY